MPRVGIPDSLSAGVLDLRDYGEGQVEVQADDDGRYVDVDSDGAAEAVADAYGGAYIRRGGGEADEEPDDDEAETCETVKGDGEVCGRELPCPYHSEES